MDQTQLERIINCGKQCEGENRGEEMEIKHEKEVHFIQIGRLEMASLID
jgi:hypothetical protein